MAFKDFCPTEDEFIRSNFEDVVEGVAERECNSYSNSFFTRSQKEAAEGNGIGAEVFLLLSALSSLILRSDNAVEPLQPWSAVGVFRDDHLELFAKIVGQIHDSELRARVADILWIRKRNHDFARIAISAYLESTIVLENPENWTEGFWRIERAFRLALSLGRQVGCLTEVLTKIESLLDKYQGRDPLYLSARLMELLQEVKKGNPKKYAALSEKMAIKAQRNNEWERESTFWRINSVWHRLDGEPQKEREAKERAAESHVRHYRFALSQKAPNHLQAVWLLQKGIEELRQLGGKKERVEELHRELLQHQRDSREEFKSFSKSVDITDFIEENVGRVKDLEFFEAIFTYVGLASVASVESLRQEVEKQIRDFPALSFFQGSLVNDDGKVIAKMPNAFSNDAEEKEVAIRARMCEQARYYQRLIAQGVVEPVRREIYRQHWININHFIVLASGNPFVPQGREIIYAKGLYAGMVGEFTEAAHLLVPQIEKSIRHVLNQYGEITSGINAEGIQEEFDVNRLLHLEKVDEIFGVDLAFDLRGLLTERYGSNLRNRLSHGLIDQSEFYSSDVVYFWWLVLKLICLPFIQQLSSGQAVTEASDANGVGDEQL